jgi:AraC family transcriptional regulator of adaptative response / DNA-3-methyladenine glycosylase II
MTASADFSSGGFARFSRPKRDLRRDGRMSRARFFPVCEYLGMDVPDRKACYRAIETRDPRFDGRFFVGVTSVGIYCRPICPSRTPKPENCRFFLSAAAAQQAGFRPCLRCRPETAPELASWHGTSNSVSRALGLIGDGALDAGEAGVDALAERLGLSGRQLRRLFQQHLGASPIAVAQTRRVLFAKQLIQETRMPMTDVALAAGFGSLRRFNETFRELFRRPPSALRRTTSVADAPVLLRLRYRLPYDWQAMLDHLEARAIDGVESVVNGVYQRTVSHEGRLGTVEVGHEPAQDSLAVTIKFPSVRAFPAILNRIRRVFDVGADIETINRHLSQDPFIAPLVASRPGLRVAGAWDGFELAVRAILGQQVSVQAARRLGSRLVAVCGEALPRTNGLRPRLARAFPSPERVAAADLRALGMPAARRTALKALAEAAIADPDLFRPLGTIDEATARLRGIRGIGEWTAQYIALRALGETDAFPASDVALLRSAARGGRPRPTSADLLQRAEPWRPWRAYAAQHLWTADAAATNLTVLRV